MRGFSISCQPKSIPRTQNGQTRRLLTYNYGTRNFQVVINGYTGAIAGKYPKSWIKITLAVLAVLAMVAVFLLVANR
jgi:hypothetical protein